MAAEHTSNDSSHLRRMTKEEVIANKDFLTNVRVSGDRIYPVTDLKERKRLPKHFKKCKRCNSVVRNDHIYYIEENTYLCEDCIEVCNMCGEYKSKDNLSTVYTINSSMKICKDCYSKFDNEDELVWSFNECPRCQKPIFYNNTVCNYCGQEVE